ncbi:MAG: carbon starvation CstA family protein [Waltera sp.]
MWLIIGGLFFGAVQDFGALYASVKNEGKSMGMIIEKYIGKTGRKLFMLFCWLFTLLSHCSIYGYGGRYIRRYRTWTACQMNRLCQLSCGFHFHVVYRCRC